MLKRILSKSHWALASLGAVALVLCAGCGEMVNKDNIKIARIGDHMISRGEFFDYLRGLSAEERPAIHNRGDSLRAVNKYIDEELRRMATDELLASGDLEMPDRKRAEMMFDAQHPEYSIDPQNPEAFNLTEADVEAIKQKREEGVEELYQSHVVQAAMVRLIEDAVEHKTLTIEEDEYQREFEFNKGKLNMPERVRFKGLLFVGQAGGPKSAEARRRLVKGEKWETLAQGYVAQRVAIPIQTEMANTGQPKFQSFWEVAAGSRKGQVLGPVIVEDWEMGVPTPDGKQKMQKLPAGYLVSEVVQNTPPVPMTLEQAKPMLAPSIYFVKYGKYLREKYGVEIFEDKLPDPSLFQQPSTPTAGAAAHDHAGHDH